MISVVIIRKTMTTMMMMMMRSGEREKRRGRGRVGRKPREKLKVRAMSIYFSR